jgi:hypothetical protein
MQEPKSNKRELDAARAAAVTSAADFLHGIAKLKQFGERIAPKPAATQRRREGDMLFDLMRLNADYMTRLSELSRAHRDFTVASFERLYAGLTSHLPQSMLDELSFGTRDEIWLRSFVLENTVDAQATVTVVSCTPFRTQQPSRPIHVKPLISALTWDAAAGQLGTPYRVPVKVTLELDPADFEPDHLYRAELSLRMAGRTRRVSLIVDRKRTR